VPPLPSEETVLPPLPLVIEEPTLLELGVVALKSAGLADVIAGIAVPADTAVIPAHPGILLISAVHVRL
jgi:hypothetical protein